LYIFNFFGLSNMISKGTIKYIRSLQLKKYRKKAQSFLVEGTKSVLELLNSTYEVSQVYATESFLNENGESLNMLDGELTECSLKDLEKISSLQTNQSVLAVAKIPQAPDLSAKEDKFYLALDRIRDPGNLGTIVRIADWYGIDEIICSPDCADYYNPKVIQATMGSFTRVTAFYQPLDDCLPRFKKVYAAVLDGENVHQAPFERGGVLVIGNESQGVDHSLMRLVTNKLTIPGYGGAESLNAAIATAVLCDNIRRSIGDTN
jgi:TrmH family RNA methyltransferase